MIKRNELIKQKKQEDKLTKQELNLRYWESRMERKRQATLHYRNRGQIFEIDVNISKNRQGKKCQRRKNAIFCPASISLYIDKEFRRMPLLR